MALYSELREAVVETLWSQWHELGVAAVVPRRHADDAVDPEALIAFTATHAELDARLRDESIDWVLRYGTYVSRARLKNVLDDWGLKDDPAFREYAATVNAHGGDRWPGAGAKPLAFRSRSRSLLENLERPALVSLRIRAIFGVGARAELIRAFLARPDIPMTAADLAADTSYGKRNVLNELEPLHFAGLVNSVRIINADRFSLAKTDQLRALVAPIPPRFSRWTATFGVLHLLVGLARASAKRSDLQNAVDAVRFLDDHAPMLASAGMSPPSLPPGQAAGTVFVEWSLSQARAVARI